LIALALRVAGLVLAVALPLAPAQSALPSSAAASTTYPKATAAAPTPYLRQHEAFLARGKAGPVGVLFLGDSITAGWTAVPHIWEASYGKFQPANFGIGGDRTYHVIWRIENGELDGIRPRVVVLMIGTNNSHIHSAAEILAANAKIVGLIRAKIPGTKVLLLAIFPRGPRQNRDGTLDDGQARMAIIREVNAGLAKLDDGMNVRYLDLGPKFIGPDGRIPITIMPDQLHLSPAGYQLWADGMKSVLEEMLR
jgi:lysophospholipase L1-like esterase